MSDRSVRLVAGATPEPGTGILRPFPSAALAAIDPFVFLDTGTPMQLGDRDIFVGPHPHRGVQPVGILFRGRIDHRDSLGHEATVESGGMQWLVSGAGALHEEILQGDADGVFHMAQLWVNVPNAMKMDPPSHHAVGAEHVPVILGEGSVLRLYAGELDGAHGPAPMPTPVTVAHLELDAGASITLPVPSGWNAAATVVAGVGQAGEHDLAPGDTPVFALDGDSITLGSSTGGQFLVMLGEPIGEPIVMGGGFVMTSRADIEQAFTDLDAGVFGELTPSR